MNQENKLDNKSMYVNNVDLGFGLYDFTFKLKKVNPDGNLSDEMDVFMNPQHAKSFAMLLSQSINEYEKVFGKINLNPLNEEKLTK